MAALKERIVVVSPTKGTQFSARLIDIRDNELWFENKRGLRWMIHRDDLLSIREVSPRRQ